MARIKKRHRPMAEINVVPYIDVMLVLLVIFMVTAPLITQGVHVELPQADAQPLSQDADDPLIISVSRNGTLYLNVGENKENPIDDENLTLRVAAVLGHKPGTPVMVRGDSQVDYGRVVHAMVLAQAAGAPSVGLITEPPKRP
jgi:biopolymer transport protein TolR